MWCDTVGCCLEAIEQEVDRAKDSGKIETWMDYLLLLRDNGENIEFFAVNPITMREYDCVSHVFISRYNISRAEWEWFDTFAWVDEVSDEQVLPR